MKYSLEVYDKVFKELTDYYPDRIYPYFFDNDKGISGTVELSKEGNLIHEKTPVFTFNGNKNDFSIDFKTRKLDKVTNGRIVFSSDLFSSFNGELVVNISLSEYKGGELPFFEFSKTFTNLDSNVIGIEFVPKKEGSMGHDESASSRNLKLGNVSNLTVTFQGELEGKIKLEDFVFHNHEWKFTLEDIDLHLRTAFKELNNYYGKGNLPKQLYYTIPILASSRAWSVAQGNESVDIQFISNYAHKENPGARLRKQAYGAIDEYKKQLDKKHNSLGVMGVIRMDRT